MLSLQCQLKTKHVNICTFIFEKYTSVHILDIYNYIMSLKQCEANIPGNG